jgi:hypothetical protein
MAEGSASSTAMAVYAFNKMDSRTDAHDIEAMLGRKLSATPNNLTRALYVPKHTDQDASHLPLYDISGWYQKGIGDTPVGSSMYMVKLGTMARPKGDGTDEMEVSYLVDFERLGGVVGATVQRRVPSKGDSDDEVHLYGSSRDSTKQALLTVYDRNVDTNPEAAGSLVFKEPFGTGETANVAVGVSYPIPASVTRVGTITHPFFTFKVPDIFGDTIFQWQIQPKESGPLRYTLVAVPATEGGGEEQTEASPDKKPEAEMRAIYHHVGLGVSLSQGYSEGVLLLPPRSDAAQSGSEGVVVASLLIMLWRLRNIDGGRGSKTGASESSGVKKLSFLKKLKGKKSA